MKNHLVILNLDAVQAAALGRAIDDRLADVRTDDDATVIADRETLLPVRRYLDLGVVKGRCDRPGDDRLCADHPDYVALRLSGFQHRTDAVPDIGSTIEFVCSNPALIYFARVTVPQVGDAYYAGMGDDRRLVLVDRKTGVEPTGRRLAPSTAMSYWRAAAR